MSFELFTDSSANIPDSLLKERNIHIIPYRILYGGQETDCYSEGIPFHAAAKEHYKRMREGKDIRTSLISKERIIAALTPSLQEGKDVFFVAIASGISGTFLRRMVRKQSL